MNVGELKQALDDFGDQVPVILIVGEKEVENFTVEWGTDGEGTGSVCLESD